MTGAILAIALAGGAAGQVEMVQNQPQPGFFGALWRSLSGLSRPTPPKQPLPAPKLLRAEFGFDFRSTTLDRRLLKVTGPVESIRPESQGLGLELPAKTAGTVKQLAIEPAFRIRGDFELTLGYELLALAKPADGTGAGLDLAILLDGPKDKEETVSLARLNRAKEGDGYVTGRTTLDPAGKPAPQVQSHPTAAKSGKLRLVRRGAVLQFFIAEAAAADFRELRQTPVGPAEVKHIRLMVLNGGAKSAVHVRLIDLAVRAEGFPGLGPVILTMHDERIAARPTAVRDGKLFLATDPPRSIPIDELVRVDLYPESQETTPEGTSNSPGPRSVRGAAKVKQTAPAGKASKAPAPPANTSKDSPVKEPTAPETKASAVPDTKPSAAPVTKSASPPVAKATSGPASKSPTAGVAKPPVDDRPVVTVLLEEKRRLQGRLVSLGKEKLTLRPEWSTEIDVPLIQVLGIRFAASKADAAETAISKALEAPGGTDTAVVLGKDDSIITIAGAVEEFSAGKLRVQFEGQTRTVNQNRLLGLVFASHPPAPFEGPYQVFHMTNGDTLAGALSGAAPDSWLLNSPSGATIKLPASAVAKISFHNGKLIFLSDLKPVSVEEVPYFSRHMNYRRDQSLLGDPLQIKGKPYEKGLALHSRCVLTYALDGRFETFKGLAGFDDSASGKGRVAFRVLGDARELFARKDLAGSKDPVTINIPVAGVRQLTLEVDFGEEEDIGDRVILAEARIYRGASK